MTVVNLSARKLDPNINYINPVQKDISKQIKQDFLKLIPLKEVRIPKKDRKKMVITLTRIAVISVSVLTTIDPTFAFASEITKTIPVATQIATEMVNGTPTTEINPPDIIKLSKWLLGIAMAATVGVAMVMSVVAASYGYLKGKTNDAFKWVADIIKSFTMAMLAPMIIITIALIAFLLFGSSEWFLSPLAKL